MLPQMVQSNNVETMILRRDVRKVDRDDLT